MPKTIPSKLAGVTAPVDEGPNRQVVIKKCLHPGDYLILEREPDNPEDPFAVKALIDPMDDPWGEAPYHIGYLTGRVSEEVATALDESQEVTCMVTEITGATKSIVGVNVELTIYSVQESIEIFKRRSDKYEEAMKREQEKRQRELDQKLAFSLQMVAIASENKRKKSLAVRAFFGAGFLLMALSTFRALPDETFLTRVIAFLVFIAISALCFLPELRLQWGKFSARSKSRGHQPGSPR